jgi:hypothetical protein
MEKMEKMIFLIFAMAILALPSLAIADQRPLSVRSSQRNSTKEAEASAKKAVAEKAEAEKAAAEEAAKKATHKDRPKPTPVAAPQATAPAVDLQVLYDKNIALQKEIDGILNVLGGVKKEAESSSLTIMVSLLTLLIFGLVPVGIWVLVQIKRRTDRLERAVLVLSEKIGTEPLPGSDPDDDS